ncbi:MAG: histone deacetylase [Candidatus Eisenbacteria bacterium]|uniref:Histone deacetylase n=1 Tax=Eiseniibacteriota bacterium TaxID=2212470 RepID=A0A849SRX1_UNCEI|nr:histone deacetylase [Candidatus Eisenbacteria bacterium]
MTARAAVIHAPGYHCDIGPHVFPMSKFQRVRDSLIESGAIADHEIVTPQAADRATLERVHAPEYLDDLFAARMTWRTSDAEMPLTEEIANAYAWMAGGTLLAARMALECDAAANLGGGFHHAFAERAEGFCYLNDLAIAIQALRSERRIVRAAVVDVDLHQGNGTAHLFRDEPEVFTFSIHQERLYPDKERSDLDIGLDDETGDEPYLEALQRGLAEVWAHRPELVLLQAGADPFHADPLGALRLTFEGLKRRDRMVIEGCRARGIPVVITLGGGYASDLADVVRIHAQTCRLLFESESPAPLAELGATP